MIKKTNRHQSPDVDSVEVGQNVEWLRLPKPRHRVEGLSRSHLNSLILPTKENGNSPPVHSIALKKRGATRGIRLIHKPSLLAYLSSLSDASSTAVQHQ